MFSESHCHLRNINDSIIEQAEKLDVELILNAGSDIVSSEQTVLTAKRFHIVKACIGIHPWNADQYNRDALLRLKELAASGSVVAISEIGLDYVGRRNREGKHVDEYVDKHIQRVVFRYQLRLAKELRLPVIVHDRTSDQEVLNMVEEENNAEIGVAIHGFTKDLAYAKRCMDLGIYISICLRDIIEAANESLRDVVRQIPLEWLLTETDSGSPEGVLKVAERIAELKGLTKNNVGHAATQNLRRLIKLQPDQ